MNKWQADTELRRLVDGMLDGTLSRTEVARLEERMEQDRNAMDYYLSLAAQEALLVETCSASAASVPSPVTTLEEVPRIRRQVSRQWMAAAAILLLAAIATPVLLKKKDAPPVAKDVKPGNARLTNEVGIVWSGKAANSRDALGSGSVLSFSAGLAELTHHSGTRVLIEGPASYEVTGPNAGRLQYGRLVAEVPPGAEGFVVEYPNGKVVDLGTEFAISAPKGKGPAEVGVFRGEVRVQQGDESFDRAAPLYTGHAVRTESASTTGLRSIPFDQDRFVRQIPTRELPWFYHGGAGPLEWDVSHLVWSPGDYVGVIKWMNGPEALNLSKMELLLDGKTVSTDEHPSSVGHLTSTVGNVYRLNVEAGKWKRGRWTLRAWPVEIPQGDHSEGILMFENSANFSTNREDFVGQWYYVHDGNRYLRKFLADGSCSLWINDTPSDYLKDSTWEVSDGILKVNFPASTVTEQHMLRDGESLLFINQPYRNGRKEP